MDGQPEKEPITASVEQAKRIYAESERILREGNPLEYFVNTFKKSHEGDLTAARCIALVFASSAVANGDGLHVLLSGASGLGKTHTAETMFRQLPPEYKMSRSFSDRYLLYAGQNPEKTGLREGVILLIDDQSMSEVVQEIFKVAVSHYHEGYQYGTVINKGPVDLKMPARISWVFLKVNDPGDDQAMNRLIQARIDENEEKIKSAAQMIKKKYYNLKKKAVYEDPFEVKVCQMMWAFIKSEMVAVEVPFADYVRFTDFNNLRNHELFFNLLMAHTAINRMQRSEIGTTTDNIKIIEATEEDFKEAKYIYAALFAFGGQRHNTLKAEDDIAKALIEMNPEKGIFTLKEVASKSGISENNCYRALHGRKVEGEVLGGLLTRCPCIHKLGKRGEFDLEYKMVGEGTNRSYRELDRKTSWNQDVYITEIESLKMWLKGGDPVSLDIEWSLRKYGKAATLERLSGKVETQSKEVCL